MTIRYARLLVLCAATITTFGLLGNAHAAAIKFTPNADLTTPFTFSVGDGAASYTFTARDTLFAEPVGVSTGGSGLVASLGAPFNDPPQPSGFFPNESFGPDDGMNYVSYNDRTGRISTSTSDVFVGLKYFADDAAFYGYARVVGSQTVGDDLNYMPRLLSYGFQTTADTPITTGEGMAPTVDTPEPSSLAFFAGGFALIGLLCAARRRPVDRINDLIKREFAAGATWMGRAAAMARNEAAASRVSKYLK